ncbi:MAG: hypothetical protein M3Z22_07540 [Verrucomicrobiota bacterium]|nr:hypothetical protein [Verrucomicrobiota bacterium]
MLVQYSFEPAEPAPSLGANVMRKTVRSSIILVVVVLALAACDSGRNHIVGKWRAVSGANGPVWEFNANGTVLIDGSPGRYTFGDGDRIKIQTGSATFIHQVEFVGDRMIWKDPQGTRTELARLK